MAIIRVLKPFVFTYPVQPGVRVPTEEVFKVVGDVQIADDHPLLSHPWFTRDHCDGKVESAAQAEARLVKEKADLEEQERQNAISRAAAEAAVNRLLPKGEALKIDNEALQEELNTPIPELRRRQAEKRAAGIVAPGGVKTA